MNLGLKLGGRNKREAMIKKTANHNLLPYLKLGDRNKRKANTKDTEQKWNRNDKRNNLLIGIVDRWKQKK